MLSMFTARKAVLVCMFSLPVLAMIGCGSLLPPEASGGLKVLQNKMNKLTGEEIQAMATLGNVPLTDEQADVLAKFLADNNLTSLTEVQALIARTKMPAWSKSPS